MHELLVESWQAMYLNVDKNKVREMQTRIPSLKGTLKNRHGGRGGGGKVRKCCQIAGGAVRVIVSAILGDPTALIGAVVGGRTLTSTTKQNIVFKDKVNRSKGRIDKSSPLSSILVNQSKSTRNMELPKGILITFLVVPFAIMLHQAAIGTAESAAKPKDFPFRVFDEKTDQVAFHFRGYSSIDHGALQLTPDTGNQDFGLENKSGRIMYHRAYRLWLSDIDDDDVVASFNSTFLVNIYRDKEWNAGEGFAFLIASDITIPEQSHGQWLGLTNASTDGNATNHIVAIEFDTEKQDFDPDGNHIGLNINSVHSNKTVSLNPLGIEISPEIATNYSVWVEYDGRSKIMEVYMATHSRANPPNKPNTPLLSEQ
ncbi:Cysteine/Histidine-rich C1 domain family protein [Prunus dulcis]|uniref:Cysteine/Histidine-rich C1 domain family protein n=1 Tax=Prunus dulcis TaxID=3755 RepID=A0A4Y1RZN2_PRUDU|nr:Cysteine/Histidine-rich C1 domain family protein [Prunus dulcis]